MELLKPGRLLLRLTDLDNVASQQVAAPLGMLDDG